jgi:hypothetical protein
VFKFTSKGWISEGLEMQSYTIDLILINFMNLSDKVTSSKVYARLFCDKRFSKLKFCSLSSFPANIEKKQAEGPTRKVTRDIIFTFLPLTT